jgi:hypothetical protein
LYPRHRFWMASIAHATSMRHGGKLGPTLFVGELPESYQKVRIVESPLADESLSRQKIVLHSALWASRTAICEANSIELMYPLVPAKITWRALTKGHETNTQK